MLLTGDPSSLTVPRRELGMFSASPDGNIAVQASRRELGALWASPDGIRLCAKGSRREPVMRKGVPTGTGGALGESRREPVMRKGVPTGAGYAQRCPDGNWGRFGRVLTGTFSDKAIPTTLFPHMYSDNGMPTTSIPTNLFRQSYGNRSKF